MTTRRRMLAAARLSEAERHTKLPAGVVTRGNAVQQLLKTHSGQQRPECGKGAIYVPEVSSPPCSRA